MSAANFDIKTEGNTYILLRDGVAVTTPHGRQVQTCFQVLIEKVRKALIRYGEDPRSALSYYSLMASYLDFIETEAAAQGRICNILGDLRSDIIYDLPADPELYGFKRRCYDSPLYANLGAYPGLGLPDFDKLCKVLSSELKMLTRRQIMTIVMFVTHFHSSVLGFALVKEVIDVASLSQGVCGLLEGHLRSKIGGIAAGKSSCSCYLALEYDREYCEQECCSHHVCDHPVKLNERCVVLKVINDFLEFSKFPDE